MFSSAIPSHKAISLFIMSPPASLPVPILSSPTKLRAYADSLIKRSSTESTMDSTKTKMTFKVAFENEAYGIVRDPQTNNIIQGPTILPKSKSLSKAAFDKRVYILSHASSGDAAKELDADGFRKVHGKDLYNYRFFEAVPTHNPDEPYILYHKGRNLHSPPSEWKMTVPVDDVFDIIVANHKHQGIAPTKNKLNTKYYNITEREVKIFQLLCPVCNTKNQRKTKKLAGCDKPILSYQFRDRMQADLIDYQKDEQPLWYWDAESPKVKWLLVIKDHFTRLSYCRPLKSKSPQYVAFELKSVLSLMGFPLIFQTDNGTEFADQLLRQLKLFNPCLVTVRGRPRTPRDQGSVENLNGPLKALIDSLIVDKKRRLRQWEEGLITLYPDQVAHCQNASWVTECAEAVHTLNGSSRYGVGQVQPYKAVFGTDIALPQYEAFLENPKLRKALPDIDKPWTAEALAKVLPQAYLKKMVHLKELDSEGKILPMEYDTNLAHLQVQGTFQVTPTKTVPSNQPVGPASHQSYQSPEYAPDFREYASTQEIQQTPPDTDNQCLEDVQKVLFADISKMQANFGGLPSLKEDSDLPSQTVRGGTSISLEEALKAMKDSPKVVHPHLHCKECGPGKPMYRCPVYDRSYTGHLKVSTQWFTDQFCRAYCRLIFHKRHPPSLHLLDLPDILPSTPPPQHEITSLPSEKRTVLATALKDDHFVLLVIEIEAKTIFVLDGLTYNLKTWSDHIMYALKVLGIIGQQETSRPLLSFPRGDTPYEYKVHKNGKRRVWEVRRHGTSMTQRDYHSCGPLMCWNVEAYCSETNTKIPSDHMQVRRDVVTKYEEFVNDFREDLRVYTSLPDVWDGEAWQSGRKVVDGGSIADSISIRDAVPENPVSKERRGKMANLVLSSDEDGAGAGTPPEMEVRGK